MGPTHADAVGGPADAGWARRVGGRGDEYLRAREGAENFPVALRALPRTYRKRLTSVYDVARVIDDLGDAAPGDRVALLAGFRGDLASIWRGRTPTLPVLRRLGDTVAECGLSERPFQSLIDANMRDQSVSAYPTYADLVGYCELSANPIGHIVLEVFGVRTPENEMLSNRVCTALQIIEHCQDVAEDRRNGRVYMPLEDLERFRVDPADLDAARSSPPVRALVEFEARRARALLDSGEPLLARLRGWARLAVTGYVAGGRAAFLGLHRADWDVLAARPGARRLDVITELLAVTTRRKATQ